jgi:hypothetical protein
VLFAGSRIEVRDQRTHRELLASRRFILAFWHARILLVSYALKNWQGAILVSDSADGEIIAQILQRQGQMTVRGSTGKGGMRALTRMIKAMRDHHRPGAVVPDGPQGPRHAVQPGVIYLAQKTGYPIVPVNLQRQKPMGVEQLGSVHHPLPRQSRACCSTDGRCMCLQAAVWSRLSAAQKSWSKSSCALPLQRTAILDTLRHDARRGLHGLDMKGRVMADASFHRTI